jgi:protein-S-isoprenylcysteine O-methyltransferase Ste14
LLKALRQTKLYDLLAAAPIIVWYAFCAEQTLPSLLQRIALAKLIIETDPAVLPASLVLNILSRIAALAFFAILVVLFAIRRVPLQTAPGFYPRFAAVAGTFLSVGLVLLPLQELSSAVYLVSLLLIIGGTSFATWAGLMLGRSISILPEARRLVTWGPYALVRHPMYLGEMVAVVGAALQYLSAWALLLVGLQFAFQFQRMSFEERLLSRVFLEYGDYMKRTMRLVPSVY